uniref:Aminotran_5 domain-containing protein n=1 Tax=Macrostomum lignano TaxID=282301 RepID=A0A1I8GBV3_9PLAT
SVRSIEAYLQSAVLPLYGNTHSSGSVVSLQTSRYREEARQLIRRSLNAGPQDAVIFCGSGATGAIHKLIGVLEVGRKRTVVLYGPFEHHSNMLPWKEAATLCVRVPEDADGGVDMAFLEAQLRRHADDVDLLIGAFSAASNVTGILTDTRAVTRLLHAHGALAVWDFACAGPYVRIDMNGGPIARGPGTPGLLVAKRRLFENAIPHQAGGGTVVYVTKDRHRYESDIEVVESGRTPAETRQEPRV